MPNVTLVDNNQVELLGAAVPSGSTDSGNPIKIGGIATSSTSPGTVADGARVNANFSPSGELFVAVRDFGGNSGVDGRGLTGFSTRTGMTTTPQPVAVGPFIFNGTSWDRMKKANLTSRIPSSAATTNATSAKASAGEVHVILATNTTATVKYLKLYNKASAPTVGTDTPILTIALPISNVPAESACKARQPIHISGQGPQQSYTARCPSSYLLRA